MNGISADVMRNLIECMYTGNISVNESNVRELLASASYLRFYAIEEACGEVLSEQLNIYNCLRMLPLGFAYNLTSLTERALKMAAEHFMELSEGFDFLQLEYHHLASVLARDDLKV